jgi:hypothetical protein
VDLRKREFGGFDLCSPAGSTVLASALSFQTGCSIEDALLLLQCITSAHSVEQETLSVAEGLRDFYSLSVLPVLLWVAAL